jgi:hypothetical protein
MNLTAPRPTLGHDFMTNVMGKVRCGLNFYHAKPK